MQLMLEFHELEITREEAVISRIIEAHPGRQNAIPVGELAARTGIDERRVRDIVKHLIERHGLPVGSSTVEPPGYYLIVDNKERLEVRRSLVRRALSILERARAYDRGGLVAKLVGQLKLLDDEEVE